jgi:hypothetical protein
MRTELSHVALHSSLIVLQLINMVSEKLSNQTVLLELTILVELWKLEWV